MEWILQRASAQSDADAVATVETPIGFIPDVPKAGIKLDGLGLDAKVVEDLFKVDPAVWQAEAKR